MVASCPNCGTELVYNHEATTWGCVKCGNTFERSQVEDTLPDGKHRRRDKDDYPTPAPLAKWAVDRAWELKTPMLSRPHNLFVLEPGCGDRAPFARAAALRGEDPAAVGSNVTSIDIRARGELPSDAEPVEDYAREHGINNLAVHRGVDFLDVKRVVDLVGEAVYIRGFDVIATNPPYNLAEDFIRHALAMLHPTGVAVFLLRLSFMSTQGRIPLFRDRPPAEVHVLHKRPSFVNGKTDNSEYGFFLWTGETLDAVRRSEGRQHARLFWIDNREW